MVDPYADRTVRQGAAHVLAPWPTPSGVRGGDTYPVHGEGTSSPTVTSPPQTKRWVSNPIGSDRIR